MSSEWCAIILQAREHVKILKETKTTKQEFFVSAAIEEVSGFMACKSFLLKYIKFDL